MNYRVYYSRVSILNNAYVLYYVLKFMDLSVAYDNIHIYLNCY